MLSQVQLDHPPTTPYFYDHINSLIYFLQDSQLHTCSLITKQTQRQALFPSHTTHSQLPPLGLKVIKGEAIYNPQGTLVQNAGVDELQVRGTIEIYSGAKWTFYAPRELSNIKLGVCRIEDDVAVEFIEFSFTSEGSRTVRMAVNNGVMTAGLNGWEPTSKFTTPIPKGQWYPSAKINGLGTFLAYCPLSSNSVPDQQNQPILEGNAVSVEGRLVNVQQLSVDRMLLTWKKGQHLTLQVVHRDSLSKTFLFSPVRCDSQQVTNLLAKEEYDQINPSFPYHSTYHINAIGKSLQCLLHLHDNNAQLDRLITNKLILIRPFITFPLYGFATSSLDRSLLGAAAQYFLAPLQTVPRELALNAYGGREVRGSVLAVTANYILTSEGTQFIIYHSGLVIREVYRRGAAEPFQKKAQVESFQEGETQHVKQSKGASIFKILTSSLQKPKKHSGTHPVNQHYLKELINDYRIQEKHAREALKLTGSVEETMAWIANGSEIKEDQREEAVHGAGQVKLLELHNQSPFCRLILIVNKEALLLGLTPKEACRFVKRTEKSFVNLSDSQHELSLNSLNTEGWYGAMHPTLSVLDSLPLPGQVASISYISSIEVHYSDDTPCNSLHIDPQNIYELDCCLTLQPSQFKVEKREISQTMQGELVTEQLITTRPYLPNTFVMLNGKLYSNNSLKLQTAVVFRAEFPTFTVPSPYDLLEAVVDTGSPGCSNHYSISSVLTKGTQFLANYPSPIKFKHRYGKLIHVHEVIIHRNLTIRYSNKLLKGKIYFQSQYHKSRPVKFAFSQLQQSVSVPIDDSRFWEFLIISGKFEENMNLPFEIGFIELHGGAIQKEKWIYQLKENLRIKTGVKEVISVRNLKDGLEVTAICNEKRQGRVLTIERETQAYCDLNTISSKDINDLLQKNPCKLLMEVIKDETFSFKEFDEIQMRKFMDVGLFTPLKIPHLESCILVQKMSENEHGMKYLSEWCDRLLTNPVTIPCSYMLILLRFSTKDQHISIVRDSLKAIKSLRNSKYRQVRRLKISQSILESQFYSNQYVSPKTHCSKYEDEALNCDILAVKNDCSRQLILRVDGEANITHILLHLNKGTRLITYKVYRVDGPNRILLKQGHVMEYQHIEKGYGIPLSNVVATYLQIHFGFSQMTMKPVPNAETNIIAQLHGRRLGDSKPNPTYDDQFIINTESAFFLSKMTVNGKNYEKYLLSRNDKLEYNYFKIIHEDMVYLKSQIVSRIEGLTEETDDQAYFTLLNLHRRYLSCLKQFSNKICLDYVYLLLTESLQELSRRKIKISDQLCEMVLREVIQEEEGPIKRVGCEVISHSVKHLVRSLQFVDTFSEVHLKEFTEEAINEVIDLSNPGVCGAVCKILLRLPYENRWGLLLVKVASLVDADEKAKGRKDFLQRVLSYILKCSHWLASQPITQYLLALPQSIFTELVLAKIKKSDLSQCILNSQSWGLTAPLDLMIQSLIRSSPTSIPMEIVCLMLQQKDIKWNHLYRVVSITPEMSDIVLSQFLQHPDAASLAQKHVDLVKVAARNPKYSEMYASFLSNVFKSNREVFKRVVMEAESQSLHADMYEVLGQFMHQDCNFGGILGAKLASQSEASNLRVAVEIFKQIEKVSTDIPQEQLFIEWYLLNNPYEKNQINPASRSPALHLLRELADFVLSFLTHSSLPKVLEVFNVTIASIKSYTPIAKYFTVTTIFEGVSKLIEKTVSPQILAEAFVGKTGILNEMIKELKTTAMGKQSCPYEWSAPEVDLTHRFTFKGLENPKDLMAYRNGTAASLVKIPIKGTKILLENVDMPFSLSKFVIGFNIGASTEKTNILPLRAELYGGETQANLIRIIDLKEIEDQTYAPFGSKIFAVNFNQYRHRNCHTDCKVFEVRLQEPNLVSLSDIFENQQKSKKGASYSVSFVSLNGYEESPKQEISSLRIYTILLSFLSQPSYRETLQQIIKTDIFDQKFELIVQVLIDLLPNPSIEHILIILNEESQIVLEQVLKANQVNTRLVQFLLLNSPTKANLNKVIKQIFFKLNDKYVNIVLTAIRIASYSATDSAVEESKPQIPMEQLLAFYQKLKQNEKGSGLRLISALLTVPSLYRYQIGELVSSVWNKPGRRLFYSLLAAVIGYYQTEQLLMGKHSDIILEITEAMLRNQSSPKIESIQSEINLLASLSCEKSFKEQIIGLGTPLRIMRLLKHETTLLVKYPKETMSAIICFFENTCIESACADEFSQLMVDYMVDLINYPAEHHEFFIHQFFFPLINAFNGVPVVLLWKGLEQKQYYAQPTEILKQKPIKSVEAVEGVNCSDLLTNKNFLSLRNPCLFPRKYKSVLPLRQATFETIYWLPAEMSLEVMFKQMSICGYKVDGSSVQIKQHGKDKLLSKEVLLRELRDSPLLRLEIYAASLFEGANIEKIAGTLNTTKAYVAEETIFKVFERKKGLQKMIRVIMTCVKNWKDESQSKIWLQYITELESYSCFPVFSSIYMNKQDNIELLFHILSGLPDKEDPKKWQLKEKEAVKFLYSIVKDVFEVEGVQAVSIREHALNSDFYRTMLERLHMITKEPKRVKVNEVKHEEEESLPSLAKKSSEDELKMNMKKKGIGYGTDNSTNQQWNPTELEQAQKELDLQIIELFKILQKFLGHKDFIIPVKIIDETFESAILPILESSFRGGSLLEISKHAELFQAELDFVKVLANSKVLVSTLLEVPEFYCPNQSESIHSLLTTIANTSKIFLTCLTGSVTEKQTEEIAKNIISTHELVSIAVSAYQHEHISIEEERKILDLPLIKKYPLLMKDLRFDYIDMKEKSAKITKHHYANLYQANQKSPPAKTIRLAQQLADLSQALPIDHTNAIYVRCDKERVDYMQALIMGSNGTPYAHGAYLFDIYFEDTYPNNPPKVNLTTTGSGQIRFNPNLYACGKVCLSLLGTWRGNAMENWVPTVSTLLQVLVSIQSIIMSEDIYFNQPGFEHEQGTVEGQKLNEAYANIVRHGNVKYAMLQNIKNPPKGFQTIIRRHFFLKKEEILVDCKKWLKLAEKKEASYNGLVSDHNHQWCATFKKSKQEYKNAMEKVIKELEAELHKLPVPTSQDLLHNDAPVEKKAAKVKIIGKDANLDDVDVTYDKPQEKNYREMDINDEKVKDRWSRYIGAMGIEAVSKQSKANVLMFGLGSLGVEIAKNIILSGCRKFTICDDAQVAWRDLSGQFFLSEEDIGKPRIEACLYKLQELNHYVRVDSFSNWEQSLEQLKDYSVVISTEQLLSQQILLDNFCRANNIKFICCDCFGPYSCIFNDFGDKFEVIDRNGEQTVEVMIENITNKSQGVVSLLKGLRHPYEDGEVVRISGVKGMEGINETVHKIKVLSQSSFSIGDTSAFPPYQGNGLARNMKLPIYMNFKSLQACLLSCNIDANLEYYDFLKAPNMKILHQCISVLSEFRVKEGRWPNAWSIDDSKIFLTLFKTQAFTDQQLRYASLFSMTCSGVFAPICAFLGGLAAQQAFKAITGKYMPVNQYFLTDFTELIPQFPWEQDDFETAIKLMAYEPKENRFEGLRMVVGDKLLTQIKDCKVFLIGSGAIGCELLKNYAMVSLGTGKGGIVVTDPDHIETSNLNRQFLFRQKHLRKPKSVTASAAAMQMNPFLKGKIRAKLDKVCESTKDIFSNQFFSSLSVVTNALDNVQARQYVDLRCLENKIPLLESGTLSSKGHVQVIIPYKTETYGNKADPAEDGEIPHCTLKMFPEEALHCIEWARDIFGKEFTMKPKALAKLYETWETFTPNSSDLEMLKDCLKMLRKKPKNFEEAVEMAAKKFFRMFRNDIMQLLYTYPLDAKMKDGKPFWKLPKRPPGPIEQIDPQNSLHSTFIASYSALICRIFGLSYPENIRTEAKRVQIAELALKVKIQPFVPSDKLAKEMANEVSNDQKGKSEAVEPVEVPPQSQDSQDELKIFSDFKALLEQAKKNEELLKAIPEQFQKDEDSNGHIDLIYSMANLRADNYRLDKTDWLTTKLKAGRITPALSTTTSCIAALQTIELIKYLKGCKLEQMRNTFLNLAVPMVQFGEPGQAEKIVVHETLTTTIWDRWELGPLKVNETTVGILIKQIQAKYGITVKALNLSEGGQVYSDLVLGLQSKKAEKQLVFSRKLQSVLNEYQEDIGEFVDFTVVFALGDVFAKHVPTLRVSIQK